MKKLVILTLILLFLCGCEGRIFENDDSSKVEYVTKLVELGYPQELAEKVDGLSEETKALFLNGFNSDLEKLLSLDNFNEELLNEYLKTDIDIDSFIYAISDGIVNPEKFVSLKNFYTDKYFMLDNLFLYYKYEKDFNDTRSLIEYVNSKAYKKGYEEYEEVDINKDTLMIASKLYYLGEFVPSDLVDVEDGYYILAKPQLRLEAYNAYKEMIDEARKEGLDFYISTSYRSYEFQSTLYNQYLKTDNQETVDTYSSRPGFSDHQTGLACDIRTKDNAFSNFTSTEEAKWLKENAYKYGFIMRYPEGKESITGYISESWHYRYVGKDAAKIIYEDNITFDEYYAYYVEQKSTLN